MQRLSNQGRRGKLGGLGRRRKQNMKVALLIPTYQRGTALGNCVRSVLEGTARPDEIVVVGRQGDAETERALAGLGAEMPAGTTLRTAWVTQTGHVPPVEAGARIASGDIVAILDDDVTVEPAWLGHLIPHFSDATVGVVGGRVLLPGEKSGPPKGTPGRLSWYGKMWGNLGSVEGNDAIEVQAVMEGNWAWRRELLATMDFDPVLNFDDGSMYGLDLCLRAHEKGFRVLYEPRAVVWHHAAPRAPELDRADRPRRVFSYCRNYTYIVLSHFSLWRRAIFLGWWFLVGERGSWGPGAMALDTMRHGVRWRQEAKAALAGKIEGVRLWLKR